MDIESIEIDEVRRYEDMVFIQFHEQDVTLIWNKETTLKAIELLSNPVRAISNGLSLYVDRQSIHSNAWMVEFSPPHGGMYIRLYGLTSDLLRLANKLKKELEDTL